LSEGEFWRLTPRLFSSLLDRYIARLETEDYHAALIASVLAEIHRDRDKRTQPYEPMDFMPTRRPRTPKNQTVKEQMKSAEVITRVLGGEVNNG